MEKRTVNILWQGDTTEYRILYPDKATATERRAAEELARFIGHGIRAVPDGGAPFDPEEPVISVGDTSVFRASRADLSGVEADGYIVRTYGRTVVIAAKRQSGILNGAYGFLRAVWGFKTYAPDEFGTSDAEDMSFGALDILDNPDFIGRDAHFKETMEGIYPFYASRMRLNGVRSVFAEGEGEGCAWCKRLWAHTQFRLLPKEKYFAQHPEWYSADGTTLCWTNEEARRELTENLKKEILACPGAVFFSVAQEDGATRCECDSCKASDAAYGGTAGTMMRFVNAVAADIEEWLKEAAPGRQVYLVTFAYQNTLNAPVREENGAFVPVHPSVVARENVVVRLAPLYNCFSHDVMTSPCNRQFRNALLGWHAVAKHLAVWSYCTGFGCYMVPFGNFETMQPVYRLYKRFGFIDVLDQGPSDTQGTNLAWLRIFLQAELLWDTDADFEGLISEFCEHFYKAAAPHMLQYISAIRNRYVEIEKYLAEIGESFHARPSTRFSSLWEQGDFWPKKFVYGLLGILQKAEEAAQTIGDDAARQKVLFRIRTESLTPRYMQINFYGYGEDKNKVERWIEDFEKDAAACGLTHYRENFKVSFKMNEARRYIVDGSCFL